MKGVFLCLVVACVLGIALTTEPAVTSTSACDSSSTCQLHASATCSLECWDNGQGGSECLERWYVNGERVFCELK